MRAVLQRVRKASVTVDGKIVAAIGPGLVAFVGFSAQDTPGGKPSGRIAQRMVQLRAFDDAQGRLNRSLQDVQGELLLIPQVTLTVSLDKGTRPSFHTAAPPETARELFQILVSEVRAAHSRVAVGVFQAQMVVNLENDGPITFVLDEPS